MTRSPFDFFSAMWKPYQEAQKSITESSQQMMQDWMKMANPMQEQYQNMMQAMNPFASVNQEAMQNWMRAFMPGQPELATNPFLQAMEQWTKAMMVPLYGTPAPTNKWISGGFPFGPMGPAMDSMKMVQRLWADLYKDNLEPTEENRQRLIDFWTKMQSAWAMDYLMPFFPQSLQNVMREAMETMEAWRHTVNNFSTPWQKMMFNSLESMVYGMAADPEAFVKAVEAWRHAYKETLGKALTMPMMGISRESAEAQLEAVDRFINLVTRMIELVLRIQGLLTDHAKQNIEEAFARLEAGETPKSFEFFYDEWKRSLSESFDVLFGTEEFAKFLAEVVDAIMEYKKAMNTILEQQLASLPVALKTDMDSLYKTVYQMKKRIRALENEIADLKAAADKK